MWCLRMWCSIIVVPWPYYILCCSVTSMPKSTIIERHILKHLPSSSTRLSGTCIYIYIYIYIYRERERDTHIYIHVYIYIYICFLFHILELPISSIVRSIITRACYTLYTLCYTRSSGA